MWVWSFKALWLGEEPTEDWNGTPIPGAVAGVKLMAGKFMTLWALVCDLEHCYKAYAMPNPSSSCPCGLCPVNSSDLPWWDFRPNADWILKIYTVQSWLASGWKQSFIFNIVGLSCLSFYPDWMHCKSLGIDKPMIGSLYIGKLCGEAFYKGDLRTQSVFRIRACPFYIRSEMVCKRRFGLGCLCEPVETII